MAPIDLLAIGFKLSQLHPVLQEVICEMIDHAVRHEDGNVMTLLSDALERLNQRLASERDPECRSELERARRATERLLLKAMREAAH